MDAGYQMASFNEEALSYGWVGLLMRSKGIVRTFVHRSVIVRGKPSTVHQ